MKAKQSVLYGVTLINYMSSVFFLEGCLYKWALQSHHCHSGMGPGALALWEVCLWFSYFWLNYDKSEHCVEVDFGTNPQEARSLSMLPVHWGFSLKSVQGKVFAFQHIGIILLDCALSLPICGGYIQSKATKNYIQQAPKTFAKHHRCAEVM